MSDIVGQIADLTCEGAKPKPHLHIFTLSPNTNLLGILVGNHESGMSGGATTLPSLGLQSASARQFLTAPRAHLTVPRSCFCPASPACSTQAFPRPSSCLISPGRARFRRRLLVTAASSMARPAGRLMTLLANQSADAKGAILSHLAPAVAKGSVSLHMHAGGCPRAGTSFRACSRSA